METKQEVTAVNTFTEGRTKRPAGLIILLILSTFNTAGGALLGFVQVLAGEEMIRHLSLPFLDTIMHEDAAGNTFYLIVKMILYAVIAAGLVLMFRLRKSGFFLYLSAEVLMLGLPFLFLTKLGVSYLLVRLLVNTIFTLFFLMMYSLYLKKMK